MPKSNPFGLPDFDPEQLAAQQRYSNWLTAIATGWAVAKEMNCRDADRFPVVALELGKKYYSQLEMGENLLEVKKQ